MKLSITFLFRKKVPQFNSIEGLFGSIVPELAAVADTKSVELPFIGAMPKDIFLNLRYALKFRHSLVHITGHVNYVALVLGRKTVLTIHDVGSAFGKGMVRDLITRFFWFWLPALFVKKITVISEFSKKELIRLVPFSKDKITVIPNAVNDAFQYQPKVFDNQNPLILHLGTKNNKNLERTIEALKGVRCRLMVIGKLTPPQLDLLEEAEIDFSNKFDLAFSEILQAYRDCDMLSFASTYEGFGLPIIEAQAVGRPVLTSHIGAMQEVAGDSACLVDPFSVDSIRAGILKIINNQAYRDDLIAKGLENVGRFRAAYIAKQYLAVYRDLENG
ncbi:glycosyltransferase family 4 protein [Aquiflexum sp. LQ15W]|uniref:glycosyltransferase family 4 protein n=1 Tax=Cognataquiflexum nitidum TaxID=2922272 RepID=UPI001F140836|nr:glycosyltransferase family 1 protein [Cognataquiflexum nitidum]MCH6201334.1 glycosyltransferase family 4 protein [Cognataquiflexum nitidum]